MSGKIWKCNECNRFEVAEDEEELVKKGWKHERQKRRGGYKTILSCPLCQKKVDE